MLGVEPLRAVVIMVRYESTMSSSAAVADVGSSGTRGDARPLHRLVIAQQGILRRVSRNRTDSNCAYIRTPPRYTSLPRPRLFSLSSVLPLHPFYPTSLRPALSGPLQSR